MNNHIPSFDEFLNESVYPERNGQLNSYDKKNFTEIGRWTVKIGNDTSAIFLFGVKEINWRDRSEFDASVTCSTFQSNGNANGSIIYSKTYPDKDAAIKDVSSKLKDMSYKSTRT